MSGEKWMALTIAIIVLWVDIGVVALLIMQPLMGAVCLTVAIPISIGIFKEITYNWDNL